MKNQKIVDDAKLKEYSELLDFVRNYASENNISLAQARQISIKNDLVRTYAGYTDESTEDNFNILFKNYHDKLVFDEHERLVAIAKEANDKEELQRLSQRAMELAGYKADSEYARRGVYNTFARMFVDRTLFAKQCNKVYRASKIGDTSKVEGFYGNIYDMTSHSEEQPFGIVNQFAQAYVDNGLDKHARVILQRNQKEIEQDALAIG